MVEKGTRGVTYDDLERFRTQLLFDIQKLLNAHLGNQPKRWLKSNEVKSMLKISHCTLQTMRSSGKLPFTKIGGVIYYDVEDLQEMLVKNKKTK